MKNKFLRYAALPILGVGILGVSGVVSAAGMFGAGFEMGTNFNADTFAKQHQQMFETQADILGLSADDVKNAWAQGKSLLQLAQEKGISKDQLKQKMKDARDKQMKDTIQTLVTEGIITQSQADARLKFMTENTGKGRRHGGGMHGGFGGGMNF